MYYQYRCATDELNELRQVESDQRDESQERRWSFFDSDVFHTVYNSYRGKSRIYYALLVLYAWLTRLLHSLDRGRRCWGNHGCNWRKDFDQDRSHRTSMSRCEATYIIKSFAVSNSRHLEMQLEKGLQSGQNLHELLQSDILNIIR